MDKKIWYIIILLIAAIVGIISGIFNMLGISVFGGISLIKDKTEDYKITTEAIKKDDEMLSSEQSTESFVPDYKPGKQNTINDSTYQNNLGYFSKQDEMYYFATATGIYKMNSDLGKCQLVIEDKYVRYLNVLGDWIYYSTENGIYKIKTDGSNKISVVQLKGYPVDMAIQYENLYYIKSSDGKLYSNNLNGENEKCICNDNINKFICIESYIYYVQAEITKNDNTISYKSISLKSMDNNGNNIRTLFENTYNNDGVLINDTPQDLCEYGEYIVCSNYFGLFLIEKLTGEIKQINDKGGYGLCVFDNFAYYSAPEPNINGILAKASLDSFDTVIITRPFEDNSQLQYIYPVEDKIILTLDCETWFYLDENNELQRITFDVK